MKKIIMMVLCLTFLLAACQPAPPNVTVIEGEPSEEVSPSPDALPTETADIAGPSETPTEPSPSPSPSPSPDAGPSMYSSDAHLVSFDPATGKAEFDYFDMLTGKDAVDWLVKNEGYSQADAQAMVDDFADSEFIEKNTNKQLRTIDLNTVPMYFIIKQDGEYTQDYEPYQIAVDAFASMYAADSAFIKSFFYHVEVKSGKVKSVNQIYWP